MPPQHSAEFFATQYDSASPDYRNGYDLFWSRVPIILVPIIGFIVSCSFTWPTFAILTGVAVVLFLCIVQMTELIR
jgi:hypothetical protein